MKPIKFTTRLTKSLGYDSGWHFIPVKAKIGEKFEKKDGSRRVVCTINGAETFQCALLPSDGDFVIVVNKVKRDRLKIVDGDRITVELKVDDSKYGLPMPVEFKEVLKQDPAGSKLFHALTAGKQRSMLYFIGKVKDVDRRIHTALIVIEHLKKNEGKIIGDQLQSELKRPIF
jgi:translation initiation factor IF-1